MKSQKIIIMMKSDIGGRFVPSGHGSFSSVKEAEIFGNEKIKYTPWMVAHEIERETTEGIETSYEYLTKTVVPVKTIYND